MRIFLSYGRDQHIDLARRLKGDLQDRGHEVWFDEDCLQPGFDWEAHIEQGLNWCAADPTQGRVVLLMTPHAVRRPNGYCLNEITAAINRNILIIPVMVILCEPPLSICRIEWLDMTDCVPVTQKHGRYELKLNRLIEALEQGKIDFEGTHAQLRNLLKPLDFSADLAKHVSAFTGRKWVFAEIQQWMASPSSSRIFWITGSPGVGKTALAAYLCHSSRYVVAFHLCIYGHDDKSDPKRCVMSLVYQLSSQLPEYGQRVASMDLRNEVAKSAATLFDNLIVQPLAPPFPEPAHSVLIVIDGLDEATSRGRNELAEFIAKEFRRTPPWLRLLITSRPDPEVMNPLQELNPYALDTSSPENLEDIRGYLYRHLASSAHSDKELRKLVEKMIEKSGGTFLYVVSILANLEEQTVSQDWIERLPQGLGGRFYQFFSRQFPDVSDYERRHRPFLEMIVAARGPLPLALAQAALKWGHYDYQVDTQGEASGAVLAPLGSLFPYAEAHIRPFHQSVVDWLTNPKTAGPYFLDVMQGHSRLAHVGMEEYHKGIEHISAYSMDHLTTHLMEVGRWEDVLELVTSSHLGLIGKWVEEGGGERGLDCLVALSNYLAENSLRTVTHAGLSTQVARIYTRRGEYDEAQKWLQKALDQTSWCRGRRVRAVALHELGSLKLYEGKYDEARRLYERALRLCRWGVPVHRDEAAANLIGLATLAHEGYGFAETIRYATQALRDAKKSRDGHHIIASERLLGSAHKTLGDYSEADLHLHAALFLSDQLGIGLEKARVKLLLGWLHYDQALLKKLLPVEAKKWFQEALVEAQDVRDLFCQLEAKMSLGWCALGENATSEAIGWFDPLSKVPLAGRHADLRAGIELGLAAIVHQKGDLERAKRLYEKALGFCDSNKVYSWYCRAAVGLGAVRWHLAEKDEGEQIWRSGLRIAGRISEAKQQLVLTSIEICKADENASPR
jgi:tetratricopeptide (TPR) repeat protein